MGSSDCRPARTANAAYFARSASVNSGNASSKGGGGDGGGTMELGIFSADDIEVGEEEEEET